MHLNKSGKVLYADIAESADIAEFLLASSPSPEVVHISHIQSARSSENLIQMSRHNQDARSLLILLASHGYYVYMSEDGVSRLVQDRLLSVLWNPVRSKMYESSSEGVVFSYQPPKIVSKSTKLVVVFSSIHETPYTSSLMRYFTQNFSSIQKYLAPETGVLRIADVGGVVGSFYLNTKYHPDNTGRIQRLISTFCERNSIDPKDVVLYGGSKGATGAFYHGLIGSYKVVAVEPIVSDDHYHRKYNDMHFTRDSVFTNTKEEEFRQVIDNKLAQSTKIAPSSLILIYSERSPQAKYIETHLINPMSSRMKVYNSVNPAIKDHPDVARNSIPITLASINSLLYGIPIDPGYQTFI